MENVTKFVKSVPVIHVFDLCDGAEPIWSEVDRVLPQCTGYRMTLLTPNDLVVRLFKLGEIVRDFDKERRRKIGTGIDEILSSLERIGDDVLIDCNMDD